MSIDEWRILEFASLNLFYKLLLIQFSLKTDFWNDDAKKNKIEKNPLFFIRQSTFVIPITTQISTPD